MYPVDSATVAHAARVKARVVGVDLKKRYSQGLDIVYSAAMGHRLPRVPRFKPEDEEN